MYFKKIIGVLFFISSIYLVNKKTKNMTSQQKKQLKQKLWAIADMLRGKMNADEYKNYILGFIFYKYLSEIQEKYGDKILKESGEDRKFIENNFDSEELQTLKEESLDKLGFFLKPSELFYYLVKKSKKETVEDDDFILEDLKNVLNHIEQTSQGTDSEDDFSGLFSDVDLNSVKLGKSENKKNEVISLILQKLSEIDFNLDDKSSDLLGDAYEYLIGEFASGAGKKGGEFYTPSQVSNLLAKIVTKDKSKIKSVYDPTCGSGSLLLKLRQNAKITDYFGQELNPTTYNLARMNMILHGIHFANFDIRHGDTLTDDHFEEKIFEAIVANPPFSAKWKSDADPILASDDRFVRYGRLAPKSAADYAFVTHMISHLDENGTMAVVLPHGVLFRGAAEGIIRKYMIEKENVLDAVIGLPSNLFFGTSIPATVLVFKKCRTDDDIFFIDASKEFDKGKNQNILTDDNIQKIFETYANREEIEKYSHKASLEEIAENEYNLNIPRYVDTFEEEEEIDIDAVAKELQALNANEVNLQNEIAKFCDELNIAKPF